MPVIKLYCYELKLTDVFGHRASITLFYVKAHTVTFSQGLESRHINGGVVNKYVLTVFLFNKAISLFFTKPLYCSFCQGANLLSKDYGPNPRSPLQQKETVLQSKADLQM